MDILNDIYLIVNLFGDTDKKYDVICKMGFYDRLIDIRTGREIFIEGMYKENNISKGLCCNNSFITVDKRRAFEIIKEDDIDEYNEYLDDIEKRDLKRKIRKKVRK